MNTPHTNLCSGEESYCRFGAQTLLKLTDTFTQLIEGVIADTDIEYVHKTRVTSRRLRAALPVFRECFSKKQYKAWNREIKQVTRLLSSARDLDVQIAFIEQYISTLPSPSEQAALGTLHKSLRRRRRSSQGKVASGLTALKAAGTLSDIKGSCTQTLTELCENVDSAAVVERAHWHISTRLDDFLSMQKYVNTQGANAEHHQMRIYAKKLRYTLEFFAAFYPKKLKKEIQTIKAFQEELGELHDCIVWAENIAQFKQKTKAQAAKPSKSALNTALTNFAGYIEQKRSEHYRRFVKLWTRCVGNGFFEELRKTSSLIVLADAKKKNQDALQNPRLRVAVLSDIHANLHALQSVLADAEQRGATVFVNAGDSVGFGACPNEVVELLCQKRVLSISGNYDSEVLENKSDAKGEKKLGFNYAKQELSGGSRSYLESLPQQFRLQAADKKLLITHGSPQSITEHLTHGTPQVRLQELAKDSDADVVVVGHSHEQFLRGADGVCFLNPGSVGRPSDGNPQAAYAMVDFNPLRAHLIRLDYPVEAAAQTLRERGLPESFAQMLLRGVSLDEVLKADRGKEKTLTQDCGAVVAACELFSKSRWPDVEHYLQVTNLAMALFDGLSALHKLKGRERCWLQCTAILHDVGLSAGAGAHNKKSAQIILNDTTLPFSSKERRIVAALARYHRKGLPKEGQTLLASLNRQTRQKICLLAGILRVADSLDYSHESAVKGLGIRISARRVTVECFSKTDLTMEQQSFNKKKDLFEKVFNRKMMLEWKQP
jgi:putative phosphoesterase